MPYRRNLTLKFPLNSLLKAAPKLVNDSNYGNKRKFNKFLPLKNGLFGKLAWTATFFLIVKTTCKDIHTHAVGLENAIQCGNTRKMQQFEGLKELFNCRV